MTRTVMIYPMDELRWLNRCQTCGLSVVPDCACTIVPLTDEERDGLPLKARLALMDSTTRFLARQAGKVS